MNQQQPRLAIEARLWADLLRALYQHGGAQRESGAFLLGELAGAVRTVRRVVLYDDLDPDCLSQGYVHFDGRYYGDLWRLCERDAMQVVADVHTHPGRARQSMLDRTHPMISTAGHIALIVPNYATAPVALEQVGVYLYRGRHRWTSFLGRRVTTILHVGQERAS